MLRGRTFALATAGTAAAIAASSTHMMTSSNPTSVHGRGWQSKIARWRVARSFEAFKAASLTAADYALVLSLLQHFPHAFGGFRRAFRHVVYSDSETNTDQDGACAGKIGIWEVAGALPTAEEEKVMSRLHARGARRLLRACQRNAVTFTKAGQTVANVAYGLPPEYASFRVLQDQAPAMEYASVREVFMESFEKDPQEMFDAFEKVPIASASLAQVHRARRRDTGEQVAVKVQYAGLEEMVQADIRTMELISAAVSRLFPEFWGAKLGWVAEEFRRNLEQELDFINEGRNSERAAAGFLSKDGRFATPRVHWDFTTRKILTMEFIDNAAKVNDEAGLARLGIDSATVAKLVAQIFAEQIFVSGHVHGDPHPGNLFVRRRPGSRSAHETSKPCRNKDVQLVLLDHGLYRVLSDDLRQTYCQLWVGAVLRDRNMVMEAATALVGERFASLFQLVLLPTSRYEIQGTTDRARANRFRAEFTRLTAAENTNGPAASEKDGSYSAKAAEHNQWGVLMTEMMQSVPRDLLVVFKTQNLVRALVHELHASSEVDRHLLMARAGALGLAPSRQQSTVAVAALSGKEVPETSRMQWWNDTFALLWFDINAAIISAVFWWVGKRPVRSAAELGDKSLLEKAAADGPAGPDDVASEIAAVPHST